MQEFHYLQFTSSNWYTSHNSGQASSDNASNCPYLLAELTHAEAIHLLNDFVNIRVVLLQDCSCLLCNPQGLKQQHKAC